MTREEAIKIIEYTFLNADGHLKPLDFDYGGGKGIVEALRMAIEELSQPSLPSDLDEAAEKYASNRAKDPEQCYEYLYYEIIDAVRFGAEWMAGQGESHETEIVSRVTGNGLLPAVTCLVNKSYKEGDKVVVQIRKK